MTMIRSTINLGRERRWRAFVAATLTWPDANHDAAVLRCCRWFLFFPARTLFHAARAAILDPRVQPRSRALHRIVTAVIGLVRPGPVPVPRVGQDLHSGCLDPLSRL